MNVIKLIIFAIIYQYQAYIIEYKKIDYSSLESIILQFRKLIIFYSKNLQNYYNFEDINLGIYFFDNNIKNLSKINKYDFSNIIFDKKNYSSFYNNLIVNNSNDFNGFKFYNNTIDNNNINLFPKFISKVNYTDDASELNINYLSYDITNLINHNTYYSTDTKSLNFINIIYNILLDTSSIYINNIINNRFIYYNFPYNYIILVLDELDISKLNLIYNSSNIYFLENKIFIVNYDFYRKNNSMYEIYKHVYNIIYNKYLNLSSFNNKKYKEINNNINYILNNLVAINLIYSLDQIIKIYKNIENLIISNNYTDLNELNNIKKAIYKFNYNRKTRTNLFLYLQIGFFCLLILLIIYNIYYNLKIHDYNKRK